MPRRSRQLRRAKQLACYAYASSLRYRTSVRATIISLQDWPLRCRPRGLNSLFCLRQEAEAHQLRRHAFLALDFRGYFLLTSRHGLAGFTAGECAAQMATIALDATYSVDPSSTGIRVFSRGLIESLPALQSPHHFLLCYRLSRIGRRRDFFRPAGPAKPAVPPSPPGFTRSRLPSGCLGRPSFSTVLPSGLPGSVSGGRLSLCTMFSPSPGAPIRRRTSNGNSPRCSWKLSGAPHA